jgi:hypothetical protein
MTKKGTVLRYNLDTKSIYCLVSNYVGMETVVIDRKRFEQWLRAEDRLSWSISMLDEDGTDRPLVFEGNLSDYWGQGNIAIITDLEHYLYTITTELN